MSDIGVQCWCFFFFNDTATTEIYTLSLHDALPICQKNRKAAVVCVRSCRRARIDRNAQPPSFDRSQLGGCRSEEHTSELQSPCNLVCRLLLEKKKKHHKIIISVILVKLCPDSRSRHIYSIYYAIGQPPLIPRIIRIT